MNPFINAMKQLVEPVVEATNIEVKSAPPEVKNLPELDEEALLRERYAAADLAPLPGQRLTQEEWATELEFQKKHPPIEGDYLRTKDGTRVKLEIYLKDGQPPFIFGRAYIPLTVGDVPQWYVQGENERNCYGWKCILLPPSRQAIGMKGGLTRPAGSQVGGHYYFVKELRVVKRAMNGTALMVEVSEW